MGKRGLLRHVLVVRAHADARIEGPIEVQLDRRAHRVQWLVCPCSETCVIVSPRFSRRSAAGASMLSSMSCVVAPRVRRYCSAVIPNHVAPRQHTRRRRRASAGTSAPPCDADLGFPAVSGKFMSAVRAKSPETFFHTKWNPSIVDQRFAPACRDRVSAIRGIVVQRSRGRHAADVRLAFKNAERAARGLAEEPLNLSERIEATNSDTEIRSEMCLRMATFLRRVASNLAVHTVCVRDVVAAAFSVNPFTTRGTSWQAHAAARTCSFAAPSEANAR